MKKLAVLLLGLLMFNNCTKEEVNEEDKLKTVKLTFAKLVVDDAAVTVADLLANIKEKEKKGFAIKSLSSSDASILSVTGKAPNYQLTIKKYGEVTLTMVLSKEGYKEVTLKAALVIKARPFTFRKLVTTVGNVTSNQLLSQIDNSTGYSIKSITLNGSSFGKVTGSSPNLQIEITKVGNFTADMVLSKAGLDATVKGAQFQVDKSPAPTDLSFNKLSLTDKFTLTAAELLAKIQGSKTGYALKSVSFADSSYGTVTGSKPNFVLNLRKAGDFTVNLVLEHDTKKDVSISAAIKLTTTKLSFRKYTHTVAGGKTITAAKLIANVLGEKSGYAIRSITLKDTRFGSVSGTTITLKRAGTFNATLTLSKASAPDKSLEAEIEVVLPSLTFPKFTIGYKSALTKAEILARVNGSKTGYTLDRINLDSGAGDYATATSAGLTIKKVGSFRATLVLTNPNYLEVTLANAQFQIDKNAAPTDLSFNKLSLKDKFTVTAAELLAKVQGTKAGYTVKSVSFADTSYGVVTGGKPLFVLNLRKAGDFSVNLVLEHDTKKDVSLSAAITLVVTKLSFSKYIQTVSGGKTIKGTDLMKNVLGDTGYTLKSITLKDTSFGTVSGTAPNLTITLKKAGKFNATLTITKASINQDLEAEIEVALPVLTFPKLSVGYKSFLSAAEIYGNIRGNTTGYTLSRATLGSGADDYVATTPGGLNVKKVGAFTATLVLTNPNYFEVTLADVQFEINKNEAPKLSFTKLVTDKVTVTHTDLLNQIQGNKTGYTLKTVSFDDTSYGVVTGSKPNFTLNLKKAGDFDLNLLLEHDTRKDVPLSAAVRLTAPSLSFSKYTHTAAGQKTISGADLMKNVSGATGYTLKSITLRDTSFGHGERYCSQLYHNPEESGQVQRYAGFNQDRVTRPECRGGDRGRIARSDFS